MRIEIFNGLNIKLKSNNIIIKQEQTMNMDYTQKTREELIAICKERKIKGYSNKKKDEIIILLQPKPIISQNTLLTPAVVNQISIIPVVKVITKQQTTKYLKPLIKWSGGKGDEIKQFEKYITAYKEVKDTAKNYDKLSKANSLNKYWAAARRYSNMLFNYEKGLSLHDFSAKLDRLLTTVTDDKYSQQISILSNSF